MKRGGFEMNHLNRMTLDLVGFQLLGLSLGVPGIIGFGPRGAGHSGHGPNGQDHRWSRRLSFASVTALCLALWLAVILAARLAFG